MTLGDKIRTLREARDYTQAELAEAMGWPPSRQKDISRYEKEKAVPETGTLERLAEALGVTLADLVGAEPLSADFVRGYAAGLGAARDAVDALKPPAPSAEDESEHSDAARMHGETAPPPPGARPETNGAGEGGPGPTSGPHDNEAAGGA